MARKLPHPISKEDFDKLVEAIKKELEEEWKPRAKRYTKTGERLRQYLVAICLGFGAGMRISEILGLQKKQKYKDKILESNIPALTFDRIENNYIRVISGKGRKDRVVPLPVKTFRQAGITKQDLKQYLPLKISYRSMQNYISQISKKVLNKHVTFHQLRHGFVTHALESGLDIHQVQMFAGHSRLDTTGLYLHANPDKALEKYGEVF